jgi:hypothetical protein
VQKHRFSEHATNLRAVGFGVLKRCNVYLLSSGSYQFDGNCRVDPLLKGYHPACMTHGNLIQRNIVVRHRNDAIK